MPHLLRHCRQIVSPTIREFSAAARRHHVRVVRDGALLMSDSGHVLWWGTEQELLAHGPGGWQDAAQTDASAWVILPGFVDCHTHVVHAGDRMDEWELKLRGASYEELHARGMGILSTVRKTREAGDVELEIQSRARLRAMLARGVTTVEIKSGYGLSHEQEIRLLEIIARLRESGPQGVVATFLGAHAVPPEAASAAEWVDEIIRRTLPEIARRKLASACDVYCEQGAFDPGLSEKLLIAASRHGLRLRVHAEQLSRTGAAEMASAIGADTADHLEYAGGGDITSLSRAGTTAVILPGAALCIGARRKDPDPPVRELIDSGAPVAVATDNNPGTSPTTHLPLMASLALHRYGMTPEEALWSITLHAARALGLEDRGTFHQEGGVPPRADVTAMECDDWRRFLYEPGSAPVAKVWIGGREVFSRGD